MFKKIQNHSGWIKSLLFIPLIFISEIFGALMLILIGYDISELSSISTMSESTLALQKFFSLSICLLLLWLFMKFIDKQDFVDLGFQIKKRLNDFTLGMLIGFSIMFSAFLILLLLGEITYEGYNINFNNIVISILLFTGVSIFEEVIFRGYMLKNLLESFNPYFALFISSIFFSLIHGSNPNVTILGLSNIFLAGIFLGASYVFTKNLWFPIALHFSWNFFQSMFGFRVSGMDFYSIIDFNILENNSLNGGEFGFESSILSLFIITVSTIFIWKYFKSSELKNK
jgi:membrane protease YdiL (CAAX protease family)